MGQDLHWLGIPYEVVGAWEIDETLGPVLRARCPKERLFLGLETGNFLSARPCHFPCADVLVAGPPCPPWSAQGIAMSFSDPRAEVFKQVLRCAVHMIKHKGLQVVLIENVEGILHSRRGGAAPPQRPIDYIMTKLRKGAPGWRWGLWRLNACDFGLHQSRSRAYIYGMGKASAPRPNQAPRLPVAIRNVSILHSLRRLAKSYTAPHSFRSEVHLPPTFHRTKKHWLKKFQCIARQRGRSAATCSYEADRDPRKQFATHRTDGLVPCLKASARPLCLVQFNRRGRCTLQRPLKLAERCILQGFPPCALLVEGMRAQTILRALGNAMAVPVVGAALYTVLRAVYLQTGMQGANSSAGSIASNGDGSSSDTGSAASRGGGSSGDSNSSDAGSAANSGDMDSSQEGSAMKSGYSSSEDISSGDRSSSDAGSTANRGDTSSSDTGSIASTGDSSSSDTGDT